MEKPLDHERVEKIAFVLKTIAHPMRVAIIDLLNENEKMSVNDITAYLGLEQSLTSHHLANMKSDCGVYYIEMKDREYFTPDTLEHAKSKGYESCKFCN